MRDRVTAGSSRSRYDVILVSPSPRYPLRGRYRTP